jgi:E3 SUMO-protein ligase PIAS1
MPQNRHTVSVTLTIKPHIGEMFRKDNLKVLLYCGELSSLQSYPQAPTHIVFPPQIEVKVNDSEVKQNFKGLKNKPGSTKPADLTAFIKKYKPEPNTIQVTYALTTRKFAFLVYLVRYFTPTQLTDRVKRQSVIRKQKVLDAMSRANADPDIAATSIHMSLKDPISTMRITVPIRSSNCTHNQCFDGAMFMQLQEQAPQWSCPICTKTIPFESLCVDEYFQEILDKTPITTEKVDIEPNGRWKVIKDEEDDSDQADGSSNKRGRAAYDDDFDDLVELDQPDNKRVNGIMRESFQSHSSPTGGAPINHSTPPVPSRETSASHSGNKRPQSAVIDLTLSDDDEDDQPPRPAKRQHVHRPSYSSNNHRSNRQSSYGTPNSIPDTLRYQTQNRTHPLPQPPPQDNSFRPTNAHNQLPRPSFNASSMSPPYQPSPSMQNQQTWTPSPLASNFPRQSSTPSYQNIPNNNTNSPMYPPASPVAHRPPLPPPPPPAPHVHRDQPPRDNYYPPNPNHNNSYNTNSNHSSWTPRPGQVPQGGLRLPPLGASTTSNQNSYGNSGGWRSDGFDYGGGNWPQSPHG